jgi:3-(3-hydroxy-phenyl)propionate hydroxylase
MTAGGEIGNLLRRAAVPWLLYFPGMRTRVVDGVTPALSKSALVVKSHRRPQLGGRLCPNTSVSQGIRLDDLVGNRFAFVASSPLTDQQRDELSRRGALVVSAAPGSELDRWLRNGRARAVFVRPDGTVMRAGRNVDALSKALPPFAITSEPDSDTPLKT